MGHFEKFRRKQQCRKDRFKTWYDANKHGRRLGMRAYPCKRCNGFHLTSKGTRFERDQAFHQG